MIKASIYCAFAVAVFSLVPDLIHFSINNIYGMLGFYVFQSLLAILFCIVLLIPLIPIFKRTSLGFSFLLFTIIGFYISAYLGYAIFTPAVRGEESSFYTDGHVQAILNLMYWGAYGGFGAAGAWYSLKRDRNA